MLIGEYSLTLGDKNRVAIPKKFRDQFSGSIILTRGFEGSLLMTDSARWELIVSEINKKDLFTSVSRDLKRYIVGGSFEIDPDNQGRFVIPEKLLEFSGIDNSVVFIGVGEWIELWNEDRWNEKLNDLKIKNSEIAERIYKREHNE